MVGCGFNVVVVAVAVEVEVAVAVVVVAGGCGGADRSAAPGAAGAGVGDARAETADAAVARSFMDAIIADVVCKGRDHRGGAVVGRAIGSIEGCEWDRWTGQSHNS